VSRWINTATVFDTKPKEKERLGLLVTGAVATSHGWGTCAWEGRERGRETQIAHRGGATEDVSVAIHQELQIQQSFMYNVPIQGLLLIVTIAGHVVFLGGSSKVLFAQGFDKVDLSGCRVIRERCEPKYTGRTVRVRNIFVRVLR
jgi:hypothetical protein